MAFQSKACCTRAPVVLRGGFNYTPTGKYIDYDGLKTYVTGSPTSKKGIIMIYDVFGLFTQTLRGADILASGFPSSSPSPSTTCPTPSIYTDTSSLSAQVFLPDLFASSPALLSNFPPYSPSQISATLAFMAGPADPAKSVPRVEALLTKLIEEHPEIESWGIVGFCWGAKIAALCGGEGTRFKAAGGCHPSLIALKDAGEVRVPYCVLASVDEVPEEMDPWVDSLMKMSPNSYYELFEDQVHGWMTSRADFSNQHNFEEYLRGYRILREFFAKFL